MILMIASGVLASAHVLADPVSEGRWEQVSSSAGECRSCEMEITRQIDHIIRLVGNNGWLGYATYDRRRDVYRGSLEWKVVSRGRDTEPYLMQQEVHGLRRIFV